MRGDQHIAVIIPARDEALSIAKVIGDIPAWVDQIIVADNGSRDATAGNASASGAIVVNEPEPGYGAACLAGISAATRADIIVFLDGDYSDYPEQMDRLVDPIIARDADMVIGSRTLGTAGRGALMPQQRFGNWLATTLIRLIWRHRYTDLGPFRAIAAPDLDRLTMADRNYGWTVEMQIRALEVGLKVIDVPVDYRRRIGKSKVSGTIRGTISAGTKILFVIARQALRSHLRTAHSHRHAAAPSQGPRCPRQSRPAR